MATVIPSETALAAHTFAYDPATFDQPLVDLLQRFYTFSDDRENAASWAACFTEDAVMKKAATEVKGREEISNVNLSSWKGQASRQHIVFRVFSAQASVPSEVMLYGLSKYVYEDGSTGEMGWAARLKLKRFDNGGILIEFYHIYPSAPPKA